MATIRCPHCGSPAMVRGRQWECGWCGDYGWLSEPPEQEDLEDLERGVLSIMKGLQEHLGDEEADTTPAWKMAVYGISHALLPPERQTSGNLRRLQAFFKRYDVCTAGEVLGAARSGKPAFEDQFVLTKERLGSFWESLLPDLPLFDAYSAWPYGLYRMVSGLSEVESFFSGEDSDVLHNAFEEAMNAHWLFYRMFHQDRAALEDMVGRWEFSENEWACRDLLIAAFPEAVKRWSAEELYEMGAGDILEGVREQDPEVGLQMMRFLLGTAEAHLQKEEAAQQLLGWDLYDLLVDDGMLPLLVEALKTDNRLARQLFQSAYVGRPQEEILNACGRMGEQELQEKLLALLAANPFPHDEIELESDEAW